MAVFCRRPFSADRGHEDDPSRCLPARDAHCAANNVANDVALRLASHLSEFAKICDRLRAHTNADDPAALTGGFRRSADGSLFAHPV
jgi:hypothetical protein